MRFILVLGLTLFFSYSTIAQKKVDDFKYVVVPDQFDFLKEKDAYQLNSLTKFLFEKYGFQTLLQSEEKPQDLIDDGCKALRANVKNNSGLLKTKLVVELIDCNAQTVFTTMEGTSRDKDFKKAYHGALRKAFNDIESLNYKYNGKSDTNTVKKPAAEVKETEMVNTSVEKESILEPETIVKTTKEQALTKAPKLAESQVIYAFNGINYTLVQKEYGYELLAKGVSIGRVHASSRSNSYLVKAGELSGLGYFDGYGNFVLERINPATNSVINDVFARQ